MTRDQEIAGLSDALAYLNPHEANNGTISLRAAKARHAVEIIEAEIAALRSKDREDGAQWMRERDDAIRTLSVWFDTSTKASEEIVPKLVRALEGYLRTCRCGGMPAEVSDTIEAGLSDFLRRQAGYIVTPVIETMVEQRLAALPLRPAQEGDEPGRSALTDTAQSGREGADG